MKPIDLFLIFDKSSFDFDFTFLPPRKYFPEVGLSRHAIIFKRVVFPEPEGPTIEMKSPS